MNALMCLNGPGNVFETLGKEIQEGFGCCVPSQDPFLRSQDPFLRESRATARGEASHIPVGQGVHTLRMERQHSLETERNLVFVSKGGAHSSQGLEESRSGAKAAPGVLFSHSDAPDEDEESLPQMPQERAAESRRLPPLPQQELEALEVRRSTAAYSSPAGSTHRGFRQPTPEAQGLAALWQEGEEEVEQWHAATPTKEEAAPVQTAARDAPPSAFDSPPRPQWPGGGLPGSGQKHPSPGNGSNGHFINHSPASMSMMLAGGSLPPSLRAKYHQPP
mmetsp:Transcript_43097/g.102551  ORF Transcript_43097/g.102551 Transcript_43097/m.102551 type:complete len:277 (-) Transcript_43097:172-1002(-)